MKMDKVCGAIYQYRAEIDEKLSSALLRVGSLYAKGKPIPEELYREVEKYRYARTVLDNLETRLLALHDMT